MEFLKMCRFTGSQEANGARQAGGGRPLAREEGHRLGQQGRPQRSHAALQGRNGTSFNLRHGRVSGTDVGSLRGTDDERHATQPLPEVRQAYSRSVGEGQEGCGS